MLILLMIMFENLRMPDPFRIGGESDTAVNTETHLSVPADSAVTGGGGGTGVLNGKNVPPKRGVCIFYETDLLPYST